MFIQKLRLGKNESFSTTTTLENLIENLHLSFNHISVLVPYSSSSDSIEAVSKNLKKTKSVSRLTPTRLLQIGEDCFDCTHIPVMDSPLMEKFGFDLKTIQKPIIVIDDRSNLPRLPLSRFFVSNDEEGSFTVLFILTKMFTGTVITKRVKKVKMFLELFDIEWNVIPYDEPDRIQDRVEDCLIFMDGYRESQAEHVFVLGQKQPSNLDSNIFESLNIDLSLAGKFKYRIEDVVRALTPAVVKGKRELDPSRFKNINK